MRPRAPLILAMICSVALIVDIFTLTEEDHITWTFIFRRIIGMVAIWAVAFIVREAIRVHARLGRAERELARSNRELEQFAGVAAHDLRAPIKMLRSWADFLNMALPKPRSEEVEQALSSVSNNAKKADAMVEAVLEVARVNATVKNHGPVDLTKLLNEIIEILKGDIQAAHAEIHIAVLPMVIGNAAHLQSVFTNLIRNALIYKHESRTPVVDIGYIAESDSYRFFVKDNGIGIKPEFQTRVFEMFKRLYSESEFPGTGIGLAFCKKVIELNGGRIWVESEFGNGSTFYFTYPRIGGRA
jgi:light-regulated signal transduction histidine kinase (bacteriophytochrome)